MKLAFDPHKHGYHFSNAFIKWSWGPISGTALCGGMAYSAIDYWTAGMSLPQQEDVPQEGDAVHKLIYDRQFDAHGNTVLRFGTSWMNKVSSEAEWAILDGWIRAGQPMPVCLFRDWSGHHTVAYGIDLTKRSFDLYDPNYPSRPCTITEVPGGYKHSAEAPLWHGFFVDVRYEYQRPPLLEGEFRWKRCFDCRLLYKPGDKAACPHSGAAHNPHGSATYVLNKNAGNGQSGWKICWKCSSLFFAGDPASAGVCPGGGIHNPKSGIDYTLAMGGEGQNNWRRCIYCEGLFWLSGGGKGGVCPASGGMHESDMKKMYTLPMAGT